jgi:hypothetical protein
MIINYTINKFRLINLVYLSIINHYILKIANSNFKLLIL